MLRKMLNAAIFLDARGHAKLMINFFALHPKVCSFSAKTCSAYTDLALHVLIRIIDMMNLKSGNNQNFLRHFKQVRTR